MNGKPFGRRHFLAMLAALGASGATAPLRADHAGTLDHLGDKLASATPDLGTGRSIAICGAGIAGLTSAWYLANAGFDVTVYEADMRYGGRSLTVRPTDDVYRRFFRDRYGITDDTYVDRFQEDGGPELVCTFFDDAWDQTREEYPQELFLNAGPGRIPSFHTAVLDLTRRLGVELEPFIFASRSNLVQADGFNDGVAVQMRQLKHDLRGDLGELLAALADDGLLDGRIGSVPADTYKKMLQSFAALEKDGDTLVYRGTNRAGYEVYPGAWQHPGTLHPTFELDEILESDVWDGTVFNDMRTYWQSSLMQPKGGMDMIWQKLLRQPLPDGRTVQDLVRLDAKVISMTQNEEAGVTLSIDGAQPGEVRADFCISTMAPQILAEVLQGGDAGFVKALSDVNKTAACKVGWQGRERFWELEDQIYGGISWTKHIISQIWYPADGYQGHTGVLTGAYNRSEPAEEFGALPHAERIRLAVEGGERLHPGFADKVHVDRGVSIAWQNMPHQVYGWADETAYTQHEIYQTITERPQGRLYQAGDFASYMPGWMEGSVRSAQLAADAIIARSRG